MLVDTMALCLAPYNKHPPPPAKQAAILYYFDRESVNQFHSLTSLNADRHGLWALMQLLRAPSKSKRSG